MPQKNTLTEYYKGFDLISINDVPDCSSKGIYLRHRKTGLEVFHLLNDDSENLFAFAFRTPVKDSTGAPHIMEHSVFCGSEKFPLKEPFTNMMNQSVNTFLNALTYSDKTVYPASSIVRSDYFNLMDVYGDAVFFPLLKKEAFLQEGHRLEIDENGSFSIQGVVYNEMKGNYSSFDSVAADEQLRSLFPDTIYEYDSGGDPLVIPSFTYEDFREFHKKYYRPDNCLVFLYGNIPTEEQLDFLQEHFLNRLEKNYTETDAAAAYPAPNPGFIASETAAEFTEPRRISAKAPASGATGSTVTVNWRCGNTENLQSYMECAFLSEVLAGHDGSPVTKALIESGLGDDIAPVTGTLNDIRSFTLSFGLHGVKKRNAKKVYALIFSTLDTLCKEGVSGRDIDSAVMSEEFANREIVRSGGPYSLVLLDRALNGWNYGEEPAKMLYYRAAFEKVREKAAADGNYIKELIKKYILENKNCSFVTVSPSRSYLSSRKKKEEQLIKHLASTADRETVRKEMKALHEYQQHRETPEETACIPNLKLSDLNIDIDTIKTDVSFCRGKDGSSVPLFLNTENTNGIAYVDVCFPADVLQACEYPYLQLYSYCAMNTGWNGKGWAECAEEAAVKTGGIGSRLFTSDSAETENSEKLCERFKDFNCSGRDWICFSTKMVSEKIDAALELFAEAVLSFEFTDLKRLKNLTSEAKSAIYSSVIPRGHRYAVLRTKCTGSRSKAVEEIWRGITQVFAIDRISRENTEQLALHFNKITELLHKGGAVIHVTADSNTMKLITPQINSFAEKAGLCSLSEKCLQDDKDFFDLVKLPQETDRLPKQEIFTASSQVGFAAMAMKASPFGTKENAAENILAHWLSGTLLWEKLRTTGGAYGAYAGADGIAESFSFCTFRDPSPDKSVETFIECLKESAETTMTPEECSRIITGAYGDEIQPKSPSGRGNAAFFRMLYGISDRDRRLKAEYLLNTKPEEIRAAAERLLSGTAEKQSAVICDKSLKNSGVIIELPL